MSTETSAASASSSTRNRGTSARAIARAGDFNQALIFYHFGSVQEVLLAAVERISEQRMTRYQERLGLVRTLGQLIAVGAECHREDVEEGNIRVLSQMLAGASSSPELAGKLRSFFDPWVELVEQAVARVVAGTPYEGVLPVHDLAVGVVALFMGTELLNQVYDTQPSATALFQTMGQLASLLEGLLVQRQPDAGSADLS
ncbi:MAG: TetR/AcrR family transcriptional regulator [Actinobacteria bacterium]|nr:TetR/AcrR family transcriptional regulator [Actinomycetota bacterium]